jgi:hypothetical protein
MNSLLLGFFQKFAQLQAFLINKFPGTCHNIFGRMIFHCNVQGIAISRKAEVEPVGGLQFFLIEPHRSIFTKWMFRCKDLEFIQMSGNDHF